MATLDPNPHLRALQPTNKQNAMQERIKTLERQLGKAQDRIAGLEKEVEQMQQALDELPSQTKKEIDDAIAALCRSLGNALKGK